MTHFFQYIQYIWGVGDGWASRVTALTVKQEQLLTDFPRTEEVTCLSLMSTCITDKSTNPRGHGMCTQQQPCVYYFA